MTTTGKRTVGAVAGELTHMAPLLLVVGEALTHILTLLPAGGCHGMPTTPMTTGAQSLKSTKRTTTWAEKLLSFTMQSIGNLLTLQSGRVEEAVEAGVASTLASTTKVLQ